MNKKLVISIFLNVILVCFILLNLFIIDLNEIVRGEYSKLEQLVTPSSSSTKSSLDDFTYYTPNIYTEKVGAFEASPLTTSDIVFLGDSLTDRSIFSELFPNLTVINRGISSDTTYGMKNRLKQINNLNTKKVFLMAGINDLRQGAPIEQIVLNYEEIFQKFQESNTALYIQSVLPVQESRGEVANAHVQELNQFLQNSASEYSYTFINLYDRFSDEANQLKQDFTIDGLHLTGAGYKEWMDTIAPYVYE